MAESADLYAYFARNVAQAAAGRPLLPFETLVPDIRAYFPTAADVQAYDSVFLRVSPLVLAVLLTCQASEPPAPSEPPHDGGSPERP